MKAFYVLEKRKHSIFLFNIFVPHHSDIKNNFLSVIILALLFFEVSTSYRKYTPSKLCRCVDAYWASGEALHTAYTEGEGRKEGTCFFSSDCWTLSCNQGFVLMTSVSSDL